jgi:predicted permease
LSQAEYGREQRHPYLFHQAALERVRALPGVETAGAITSLPVVGGGGPWNYVHADGRPPSSPADRQGAVRRVVSPGYFKAMGIPLLRGRTLDRTDDEGAPRVALIGRSMADTFFPGEDPIGRSIVYAWDPDVYFEIVGVVGDVPMGSIQMDTESTIYWALAQHRRLSTRLVIRTAGDPTTLASVVRAAIREVNPNVAVSEVRPMTEVVSSSLAQVRFRTLLLSAFAGVAMLLAALGLYGVLAQLIGRRTHELGVRIAIGAERSDILRWVMRQGLGLTGMGLVLGLLGAVATTRFARGMLFGVEPLDPLTFGGMVFVLSIVALAAALIPAWRATRIDPVQCLRSE